MPPDRPGRLGPLTVRPLIVDAEFVKANLTAPQMAIVDARNRDFYTGTQTGRRPGRSAQEAATSRARRTCRSATHWIRRPSPKPAAELQALFADAGVKRGDTVIAYCHIGQQATQVILAARTLGLKVLLYDGSFEDWSRKDYPVERSPKP